MKILELAKLISKNNQAGFLDFSKQPKAWNNININDDIDVERLYKKYKQKLLCKTTTLLCISSELASACILKEILKQEPSSSKTDGFKDTALHKACRSHVDAHTKVKLLIQYDPFQANKRNNNGCTPLHIAVKQSQLAAFLFLVSFDCIEVNVQTKKLLTPLHIAANFGRVEIVQTLLARDDIDVNLQDINGDTALHHAAYNQHVNIYTMIKKHQTCSIGIKNFKGLTAAQEHPENLLLLQYSLTGSLKEVIDLIETGAECVTDFNGDTPLHNACKTGTEALEKVCALIKADPSQINIYNSDGLSPFHLAASHPEAELLQYIVDHVKNLDINALSLKEHQTALHISSVVGNITIVRILRTEADTDVNAQDFNGNTPLHLANMKDYLDVVAELKLDPCCKSHIKNKNGETPEEVSPLNKFLIEKATNATKEEIQAIIDKGAVCISNKQGNFPLHLVCMNPTEAFQKAKILSSYDRSQLAKYNDSGYLPIHLAIMQNDCELVKYLGDKFDINATTAKDGRIALHIAAQLGYTKLIENLLKTGRIKVNVKDNHGDTAAHYAARYDNQEALKVIHSHKEYDTTIRNCHGKTADEENPFNTSFMMVFADCSAEYAVTMLNRGVKCLTDDLGNTLMHKLCHSSRDAVEKCDLLETKQSDLLFEANSNGDTPFHEACKAGNTQLVSHFLTKPNLQINAKNKNGYTALHIAVSSGYKDIVNILLCVEDLFINAADNNKETALHLAARRGTDDITQCLLSHQAIDVNAQDISGNTPWHVAMPKNKWLLGNHPNFNQHLQNSRGEFRAAKSWDPYVSFSDLANNTWIQQKTISTDTSVCSMSVIKGNIYCCCYARGILIFNPDLDQIGLIEAGSMEQAHQVAELNNVDLAVAASKGLYYISHGGAKSLIKAGEYWSATTDDNRIFAVPRSRTTLSTKIVVFAHTESGWLQQMLIKLPCGGIHWVTVLVTKKGICACCWDEHRVYILTHDGELIKYVGRLGSGHDGLLDYPYLCQGDSDGNLLIADRFNHRLQVLSFDHRWSVIQLDTTIEWPRGAGFLPGCLYAASYQTKKITLFKPESSKTEK